MMVTDRRDRALTDQAKSMKSENRRNTTSGGGRATRLLLVMICLTMAATGLAAGGAGAQESDDEETTPIIGEESSDLAATGVLAMVLVPTGLVLVLIGVHLTMFGQPALLRGAHSAPNSKLRSSYVVLAASSIAESVASARRQRR